MDLKIKEIIERSINKKEVSGTELAEVANYYFLENPTTTIKEITTILKIPNRTFYQKLKNNNIKRESERENKGKGLFLIENDNVQKKVISDQKEKKREKEKDKEDKEIIKDSDLSLVNQNLNLLIDLAQQSNLFLENIDSKIMDPKEIEDDEDFNNHKSNLGNINSKEIPDFFDFLKQYKDEEPFFQRRTFQFNPDAFEMFLVANKKQRIQQREAISQAFFLYAYVYLTKEEFENIQLLESNENNEDDNDKYNYDSIFN